jgi:DNA-binding response OmpR family regulator
MVKLNPSSTGARPCVLIIDDEASVRVALRSILQPDYDILEADSAPKALELLKNHRTDLVTLDVLMAGQDGLDTLRHIRESEDHKRTPVIMITGHASVDSACEALRLGATDYLQKPFGVEELRKSVRNGLRLNSPVPLNGFRHAEPEAAAELAEPAHREDAERNLVRLGKASAAFVHDLASPLQVLTILNSLCSQRLSSSAAQDKELREILQQIECLLAWSSELVKGWQTIAVPATVTTEMLDVGDMLEHVMEVVAPYARLNSVTLTRAPLAHPMQVRGDRVQIERALVNLSLNGIKASTARAHTVEISAVTFHDQHIFRFADTGLGFSPERMKEVLNGDPFTTISRNRRGLGLFIADWIAVNHGGKLQFICEKGLGTTVEFFLPTPAADSAG